MAMTIKEGHDVLAGKRRFVQSLTRSRRFVNDDQFLTPVSKKVGHKSNKPAVSSGQSTDETNNYEKKSNEAAQYY
jgi:hypothetical protein